MEPQEQVTLELYSKLAPDSEVIRLLHLLPNDKGTPRIYCELREYTLQEAAGRYKALSYTWAGGQCASGLRPAVYCNNVLVDVTPNLYEALHRLREPLGLVTLWVDLLCINQADVGERTHQVGMMRDIYAKCSEVIIWLGAGGEGNSSSLRDVKFYGDERDMAQLENHMRQLSDRRRVVVPEAKDFYGAFCLLSMLAQGLAASKIWYLRNLDYAPPIIRGLDAILRKPWWARIWVVQETVVAQRAVVYCNNISMPWKAFSQAASRSLMGSVAESSDSIGASAYGPSLARFQRMVGEIDSTRRAWEAVEPSSLLPLLRKFRGRGATDNKDKVFALLGLVTFWGQDEPLLPDYGLRLSEVYLETTKRLIRGSKSLAILSGTIASRQTIAAGFPTWITDWSYVPPSDEHARLGTHHLYRASGDAMDGIQLHGRTLLQTDGYHIDSIGAVYSVNQATGDKERLRASVMEWRESMAWPDHAPYRRGGTVHAAFWRTICGNAVYVPGAKTERARFRAAAAADSVTYRDWSLPPRVDVLKHRRTSIISGTVQGPLEEQDAREVEALKRRNAFHLSVDRASRGRCFFVTKHGLMGLAAPGTRAGDDVFALQGSRVPLVLRRASGSRRCLEKVVEKLVLSTEEEKAKVRVGESATAADLSTQEAARFRVCNETHDVSYQVVGDAYVHGVMDGSALWDQGRTGRRNAEGVYLI